MTVYILNVIVVGLLGVFLISNKSQQSKNQSPSGFIFLILFLWWFCLFTFRYKVGSDSWAFNRRLEYLATGFISYEDYLLQTRDFIFASIEYFFASYLKVNRITMYAVVATLIYAPILITIRKEAKSPALTLILFVLTLQFCFGYNGTRQAVATSFIMMAYYLYFRKKQYIKSAVWLFVAFGMHAATLFVIPFLLLSTKKFKSAWIVFSTIFCIVTFLFLSQFWASMIYIFEAFDQYKMARDYAVFSERSANVIRIFMAIVPILLGIWKYDKIKSKHPDIDGEFILLYFSALATLYVARTPIFMRFAALLGITTCLVIPKIMDAFEGATKQMIINLMLVFYFIYMCGVLLSGDSRLYPYQFIPTWNATW